MTPEQIAQRLVDGWDVDRHSDEYWTWITPRYGFRTANLKPVKPEDRVILERIYEAQRVALTEIASRQVT